MSAKHTKRLAPMGRRSDPWTVPVRVGGILLLTSAVGAGVSALVGGCGTGSLFNPAFVNPLVGGQVPVTPGPGADFVLARVLNTTDQVLEFIVTIEREVLVLDDQGNFQVDEATGTFITRPQRETVRLTTAPGGNTSELGVLFPCDESPVTQVGLGENLLPTDRAVFVGGEGAAGATGFGVPAGDLNPLLLSEGNFNCGDTVIFRAFRSTGQAGGVGLETFLLPGSEQPSIFRGPDTFVNLQRFIESQVREDEP